MSDDCKAEVPERITDLSTISKMDEQPGNNVIKRHREVYSRVIGNSVEMSDVFDGYENLAYK